MAMVRVRVEGKDPTTLPGAALNDARLTPPKCEIRGWQKGEQTTSQAITGMSWSPRGQNEASRRSVS